MWGVSWLAASPTLCHHPQAAPSSVLILLSNVSPFPSFRILSLPLIFPFHLPPLIPHHHLPWRSTFAKVWPLSYHHRAVCSRHGVTLNRPTTHSSCHHHSHLSYLLTLPCSKGEGAHASHCWFPVSGVVPGLDPLPRPSPVALPPTAHAHAYLTYSYPPHPNCMWEHRRLSWCPGPLSTVIVHLSWFYQLVVICLVKCQLLMS